MMTTIQRLNRYLGLSTLVLSGLAACGDDTSSGGGGTGGSGGAKTEPAWRTVFEDADLDRALLSVWGTSSESVYVVGGPLGNSGKEALALHYDGDAWTDLAPGGGDSYWWVHGSSDDDVWMVGERGRMTHFDGETTEEFPRVTDATIWGAYAFSPDDAWAVGGTVGGPATTPDDVLLHWDGTAWNVETLPGEPLGRALFKIWGPSPDELFVVGELGLIWHLKDGVWNLESDPPLANGNLTTVAGCSATEVFAVGSRSLLSFDGTSWKKEEATFGNDVNGVACQGEVRAMVGIGGLKQRWVDGAWKNEFTAAPHGDLHATWIDETGAIWAAGGDFISSSKPNGSREGIVARFGPGQVSSVVK